MTVLFLVSPITFASDQHASRGTILVIAQNRSRVIIAADSRINFSSDAERGHHDRYCKIAALSNDLVFGGSGLLGDWPNTWSTASEMARAVFLVGAKNIDEHNTAPVFRAWANFVIPHLSRMPPTELLKRPIADGSILRGVLVGRASNHVWVWLGTILMRQNGDVGWRSDEYLLKDPNGPTQFNAFGEPEIFDEIRSSDTARAIRERKRWSVMHLSEAELDRFKTRRFVELTEMYGNKAAVGGPVDEIEIDTNGVRWIQVKQNCQGSAPVASKTRMNKKPTPH